ncbi:50S ribosomal protein L13 [uncultured archaeon]|nr:50S ribosomal protein L13 [uncultured archaeon]
MKSQKQIQVLVLNAENAIAGKLSACAAKSALQGVEVKIINSEKAVITGDKDYIVTRYFNKREQKNKANPEESFKLSRRPDLFLKKMIKGMLPKHNRTGSDAEQRITCYYGNPENLKAETFKYTGDKVKGKLTSIESICIALGWKNNA